MSMETLAERVSEMIWADYDDRRSNGEEISFTQFMQESHEIAVALSQEFPKIELAEGEYLDEDNGGDVDSDYEPTERLVEQLNRTGWDQGYRKPDGTTVIFRAFAPEENDLIVARDFANDDAAADWLAAQPKGGLTA